MTAKSTLDKVSTILGAREANYDSPSPNFQRIADGWNWYLNNRLDPNAEISAFDIAQMMVLLKIAREQYKHTEDNLLDEIGYAVCGAVIAGEK